jgi:transposase
VRPPAGEETDGWWGGRASETLFVGVDWGETQHDVLLMDEAGATLARARVPEGLEGLRRVHELVGAHLAEDAPDAVVVGIETERGLLVRGLVAAGYTLYALNPLAAARYRERHTPSGAKSDVQDAKVLADLVRPTATTTAR